MADVSITAANVATTTTTVTDTGIAGATITAGQTLYRDVTASNRLKPALSTTAVGAVVVGIALNNASSLQPVKYAISGDLTAGGTLVTGKVYAQSSAAGAFCPVTDLDAATTLTWYATIIGVATSTTTLRLGLTVSGMLRV